MAAKAGPEILGGAAALGGLRPFLRLGAWVVLAGFAVTGAAVAARSDPGAGRLASLLGAETTPARAPVAAMRTPAPDAEAAALGDTVRRLAAERDKLLSRLDALELALEVTGSVPPAPAKPASASAPARVGPAPPVSMVSVRSVLPVPTVLPNNPEPKRADAAPVLTQLASAGGAALPPASSGLSELAPEPRSERPEFAVDLGSETSVEALRALWVSVKAQQGALLDELRPLVAVRETGRPGGPELRLVAGPLANTLMAGRICAVLSSTGRPCKTASFEGQRLAGR